MCLWHIIDNFFSPKYPLNTTTKKQTSTLQIQVKFTFFILFSRNKWVLVPFKAYFWNQYNIPNWKEIPDTNGSFFKTIVVNNTKISIKRLSYGIVSTTYTENLKDLKQTVGQCRPICKRLGTAPLTTLRPFFHVTWRNMKTLRSDI